MKAIVYDLPSENIRSIGEEERDRIRSVRVSCTQLLHALGIGCTESVILVPDSKINEIGTVISRVEEKYRELSRELGLTLRPIIKTLDLTSEQGAALITVAQRRLLESLDETIERVASILDILRSEIEYERRRRIINNLRRLRSEWERVFSIATELGIDISRDYGYLVELLMEGLNQ